VRTLSVGETVVGETLSSKETLLGGEPLGGRGPVGHDEPGEESDEGASDTLNEEEPLPSLQSSGTVEVLSDDTGEESGESTGNGGGGVVDGEPGGELVLLVP
jgi:hypothetical protein